MSSTTLTRNFRITVPLEVREALELVPGQKLAFICKGSGVSLVPQATLSSLIGIAAGASTRGVRDGREREFTRTGAIKRETP